MLAHGLTAAPAGPEDLICDEHGLDPELLIFDALTFTLTTGDAEWRPSAVETIEGIRLIKREIPHVKTSLGVSKVLFKLHCPVGPPAASALGFQWSLGRERPTEQRACRAGP